MKELTIEQKAQRYNEALERAKGVIEQNPLMEYLKKGIEYIFPELAESEDEKMMNQLHSWMKEFGGAEEYTEKVYQWIKGLLKKQSEHARFIEAIQVGDQVTKNEDGVLVNLSQLNRVAKKDEKQGEPTEINPSEFDSQLNRLLGQFKSLPKEELVSSLSFYLNVVQNDGTYKEEKRGEPKPAEWSEEDINMIDWLIRCCEKEHEELCNDKYGHQDIVSDLKRDCRKKWDWLESLKNRVAPQKQWKPSDNELEALRLAAEKDGTCLMGLYEQLKKQKE